MHLTLLLYLSRNYLYSILVSICAISTIFIVANFIDLLQKVANKTSQSVYFLKITQLVFAKVPYLIHESFPYIMFIAAILVFQKLSKRNEYIILKASGLSLWQFIMPFLLTGFILGIFLITIFNPISSSLLDFYRKEYSRLIGQSSVSFSLFDSGIWFVDQNLDKESKRLVHAKFLNIEKMVFTDTYFVILDNKFNFLQRIYADTATLEDQKWNLSRVKIYMPNVPFEFKDNYELDTNLTEDDVKNSLVEPEVTSIWGMPYLIHNLNLAGYSSLKHVSYLYKILARPLLICGLILISASFALKSGRNVRTATLIFFGSLLGFVTYFFGELTTYLGSNGQLNPLFAILLSTFTVITIGIAAIYHSNEV
jgi:lipopolysaccharide export system permease protein